MSPDANCIFCKIVAGEIPAAVIYDEGTLLAFLGVAPLAEGHVLVIPREHHAHLVDLPTSALTSIAVALPKLGRALMQVTGAEGFNVLVNQGEAAGQVVPHVHFHLIPRKSGDGLGYRWNAGRYETDRANELAAAYKSALSSL